MILLDTSIWADHFRKSDPYIQQLLNGTQIAMHPMVAGELACGHLKNRRQSLILWQVMPQAKQATHQEVMQLIESNQLMGRGVGFIDFHLIASCMLSNLKLWTKDKRLQTIAKELGIAFEVEAH